MAFTSHQKPSIVSSNEQLRCSACKVNVLPNERNSHYRSDWHRYNVKRKCVNMSPIQKSVFEAKLKGIIECGREIDSISNKKKKKALNKTIQKNYDTLISNDQWNNSLTQNKAPSSLLTYTCTLCVKIFKTHQQCISHLNTKKHKKKFIKYHENLRNEQQEEINAFHATNDPQSNAESNTELDTQNPTMDKNLIPLNKLQPIKTIKNNPFIAIKQKQNKKNIYNYKTESKEGPPNKNKNYNYKKIRKCIPSSHCLFCKITSFENIELCLEHMMQKHGFFIPYDARRLINLNELLTTVGEIVGKYYQCVWCWKIFKSLKAVQLHMRDKGHCKLQMEYSSNITYSISKNHYIQNECDDSPFVKYFDFNKILNNNNNNNNNKQLMIQNNKTYITNINECDELVRSDGTLIGHRHNLIYYKQKHKYLSKYHETQTEQQIIAQINNPQKKYKLEEIQKQKHIKAFEKSGATQQTINEKIKDNEAMHLQTRAHKVNYQNWTNLQKSKQLY